MAADYQPKYEKSRALVVGINSYNDPRFMPLGEAEADATKLADLLIGEPYKFDIKLLLGKEATRRAILGALFDLRSTAPDDRVIVYFAGHGYTLTDNFGQETGFLAAADTVPEQDFTALELNEITDLRRHAKAKHIAFIFDACFSGQALGLTRASSVPAEKFLQRRAYQVLSAGAGDQPVQDANSMTTLLVDVLGDESTQKSGMYTVSQLGLYLRQSIASDSKKTQIPQFGHLTGSQGGEFVLFMGTGPRLPHDVMSALLSSSGFVRWGAVAELAAIVHQDHEEQAVLALEWLERLSKDDPEERVRKSAQRALDRRSAEPASSLNEFNPPSLGDLLRESGVSLGRIKTEHATSPVKLEIDTDKLPSAILFFTAGPAKDRYLALTESVTSIGRTTENTLPLADTRVSRKHAQLELRDDGLWLVDSGSTNGTFVNEKRISDPVMLNDGDYVKIGKSAFTVYVSTTAVRASIEAGAATAPLTSALDEQKVADTPLDEPDKNPDEDTGKAGKIEKPGKSPGK